MIGLISKQLCRTAITLLIVRACAGPSVIPPVPTTMRLPITDKYHGVRVNDDYQWLEDQNSADVRKWNESQNARTRTYLDSIPARSELVRQLKQFSAVSTATYEAVTYRAGTLLAEKTDSSHEQPYLVGLPSIYDKENEQIIFDPNRADARGSIGIDFFQPSLDGKFVAISLSQNGSENGTTRVVEVTTGKELPDRVVGTNSPTAAGSIVWKSDDSGFYYTRSQGESHLHQQVYFHKLGTDCTQDVYVFGEQFPAIAEIRLSSDQSGHWLLASVAKGDGGAVSHYLMNDAGGWARVTRYQDAVGSAKFGQDGYLYLLSRHLSSRGDILRVPLKDPQLSHAKVVISSNLSPDKYGMSVQAMVLTERRLFVVYVAGGPNRVRVFDHVGHLVGDLPVPDVAAIFQVVPLDKDDVLFYVTTYLTPGTWYCWRSATGRVQWLPMSESGPAMFPDAEVVRDVAVSKDGTRIPLSIIRRKGLKLDGSANVLLYGYGGFGISERPYFVGSMVRLWMDAGGVYVDTNLRGGSEFGEEWHQAGKLTKKQNVFDDFIACAEYLIKAGYTSPDHLAIMGGSNGGLLVGVAITQRPDLFRAAVAYSGIYDMLRLEQDANGAFNATEFGTVTNRAEFEVLYSYSPYHHVKANGMYPAILFLTGENDGRVNPYHSRKMVARLQEAGRCPNEVFLRVGSGGHGLDDSQDESVAQDADVLTFLLDQLRSK
jgi:prolyl oligopeptidase